MVIDLCDSSAATVRGIDTSDEEAAWSEEDRRACEAVGETPGDAVDIDVAVPLQLGGRMRPDALYPRGVTRHGFRGCIKNLVHNGQVRTRVASSAVFPSNWASFRP